jgi:hypothetical protein
MAPDTGFGNSPQYFAVARYDWRLYMESYELVTLRGHKFWITYISWAGKRPILKHRQPSVLLMLHNHTKPETEL